MIKKKENPHIPHSTRIKPSKKGILKMEPLTLSCSLWIIPRISLSKIPLTSHLKQQDSSANQMPAQLDITSDQTDISRETNEEAVDAQWRLHIAKDNLTRITYSRKTCSQPILQSAIPYRKKEAILHSQTSDLQDNTSHVKFLQDTLTSKWFMLQMQF